MAFDRERAATVVAVAAHIGVREAAEEYGVSVRSVHAWRAKCASDPLFADLVTKKKEGLQTDWKPRAISFLKSALEKLEELVQKATVKNIREVAGAIKVVGELQVVREALGGQQPRPDRQGPAPRTPPGSDGAEDSRPGIPH